MKLWCPVDDELFISPEAAPMQEINGWGQLALHVSVKKILASDLSTLPVTLPRSASAQIRLLSMGVRRQKS
jgi:hypothetical protein